MWWLLPAHQAAMEGVHWTQRHAEQIVVKLAAWLSMFFAAWRQSGDNMLNLVLQLGARAFPSVNWDGAQTVLDQINYVFPLSESLVMGLALLELWVFVLVYRFVKSWIPTVSS